MLDRELLLRLAGTYGTPLFVYDGDMVLERYRDLFRFIRYPGLRIHYALKANYNVGLLKMLRDAGAKEVHLLIASPPFRFPCFYGIDVSTRAELMAAHYSVEEMRQQIGADSLHFLSVANLIKAIDLKDTGDAPYQGLTVAYFTGDYPTPLYDYEASYLASFNAQEQRMRKEQLKS